MQHTPGTNGERHINGSSAYYDYTSTHHAQVQATSRNDTVSTAVTNFANLRDSNGYGRNGTTEVQLTIPMTSQITPGSNTTPALVAQALSGM